MDRFPSLLNNTHLKCIAMVSMVIDHICLVLLSGQPVAELLRITAGRIAMPLFAFLLAEGFFHTHSRKRYLAALTLFALLSEPAYDLAMYGRLLSFKGQNVLFTLAFGLLLLCILDAISRYSMETGKKNRQLFALPVIAAFLILAWFFRLDQDIPAMSMILLFYILHWQPLFLQGLAACTAAAVYSGLPGYFLAMPPLLLYNGKRGRIRSAWKYLFYAVYPVHLLILGIIAYLL